MSKIQKMLAAGIPVVVAESDENKEFYSFEKMTPEQEQLRDDILSPPDRDELRRRAYLNSGITVEALTVALVEKYEEGRPEAMSALQEKRALIKANKLK